MANPSSSLLVTACLLLAAALIVAAESSPVEWVAPPCRGTVAECMGMGAEAEMDSEINRRILATADYISYGALESNTVPCSERGASYYNCQKGAEANPYSRGCSEISRCRS